MTMLVKTFLRKAIKAVLPYGMVALYCRYKKQKLLKISYGNTPKNYCPICNRTGYFEPFGAYPRQEARCPHCRSLERHRLLWLFLKKQTDIFNKGTKNILHVAAEPCLEKHFRRIHGKNYLTADLNNPSAMVKMDITDIHYPNRTFDIIICNHVLEHIIEDKKAMSEFYRVLKNNGWAILLVPINDMEKTYEDNSITTEAGRLKAFGHEDHVRRYGRDYSTRLQSVGFNVNIILPNEFADEKDIKNMNLPKDNIYYCKK
jgi:SAM-dependent methyltransferase